MTIRFANINDQPEIFSLFTRVYNKNYSHIKLGEEVFCTNTIGGRYKSIVCINDGTIIGHAGIHLCNDYNILNALVVDPFYRNQGIGRLLFEARLDYCIKQRVRWVIGYSMLQHQWSQRLYGDSFYPIGLAVGYSDVYASADEVWNMQNSNAEIILCRNIRDEQDTVMFDIQTPILRQQVQNIVRKMGINATWNDSASSNNNQIFLGFTPTLHMLFRSNFLDTSKHNLDFNKIKPFSKQSIDFINNIRVCLKILLITILASVR